MLSPFEERVVKKVWSECQKHGIDVDKVVFHTEFPVLKRELIKAELHRLRKENAN